MRAAVFRAIGRKLELDHLPDPTPQAGEIVVAVGRCGICGSDLHMTEDPSFDLQPGMVLGHEFAGEIVAVGKDVDDMRIGDTVCVPPIIGCGHCIYCVAGEPGHCTDMKLIGGGYGEFVAVPARQAVRMPRDVSVADGALVEPLAVALHGLCRSAMQPGDSVIVLGAGPIGLATAFWARRRGARQVLVTDLHDHQRDRAHAMGATHFISGVDDPVAQADRALGMKADVVFECVGVPGMIAQAVEHVRQKGKILVQGLCTRPDSFVPFRAISKECGIQFSNFFKLQEYQAALDMLASGAAEPQALLTDTITLDALPDAFEALRHRTHQCKVQIAHKA